MWIKISPALFINSDRVAQIVINDDEATLFIGDNPGYSIQVPADAAHYFLECVEVQAAQETAAPEPPSLKTQIAQMLRFNYPSGLTKDGIYHLILSSTKYTIPEIDIALDHLQAERVLFRSSTYPTIFQHAAHIKPSPDPSAATEDS